jgi:enoyl-CoA hydratase/carnithine racemase
MVKYEKRGHIGILTIDRPEARNAVNGEVAEAMEAAIDDLEGDDEVWIVILTGNGPVFSAGADLKAISAGKAAEIQTKRGGFGGIVIRERTKPIIAAVDGPAFGLGTTILLHCDYVVASEWAIFAAPVVEIGLPPEGAVSIIAPRLMGHHRAFGMLVMGDQFDAQQAMYAGLVNRVVPADAVDAAGFDAARTLAAKPPEAVRMARRLMRGERREITQRIDLEATSFSDLLRSPAARDALEAYIDAHR